MLVVKLVHAVGVEVFAREHFPEFFAARPEIVQLEGKRGLDFVDADEMELGEIGEQNPFDWMFHLGDFRAEAVILDIAQDLFLVFLEEVLVRAIEQALGFDEKERAVGFQQIIHRVGEDFELAGVFGFGSEAESLKEGFDQRLLGFLLRLLFVKPAGFKPARFGDEGFESAKEFFFHPGFRWHSGRVCAGVAAASIPPSSWPNEKRPPFPEQSMRTLPGRSCAGTSC